MLADIEWYEYTKRRARESVVSQAVDAVLERYHYKRALLKAMPKGTVCAGCPYWDGVEVRCRIGICDAEREEPNWHEIEEEEKEAIRNVRAFLQKPPDER
jgi:hypothetical protein